MLPFDSQGAYDLNSEVFKTLKEYSYKSFKVLGAKVWRTRIIERLWVEEMQL
jgi:hypothetical protein